MGRFGQRGTGSHLRPSGLEIDVEDGMGFVCSLGALVCAFGRKDTLSRVVASPMVKILEGSSRGLAEGSVEGHQI